MVHDRIRFGFVETGDPIVVIKQRFELFLPRTALSSGSHSKAVEFRNRREF